MLTVLIECKDQESLLAQTLSVLVAGAVDGLISEVVILDHGSEDGTMTVADAAGCRVYHQWELETVIAAARGSWVLFLEPGARPQAGWIEEVTEYLAGGGRTARFTASSVFRKPLLKRLLRRAPALEHGFLISKAAASLISGPCKSLAQLAARKPVHRLRAQIIPAWVLAERL